MDLFIPTNALVILIGPAGCGKTTFALTHFLTSQVVSSAQCRELVSDERYSRDCEGPANSLLRRIVAARLSLKRLTVADATNIRPIPRQKLLRLARSYRAPALGVIFEASLPTCLQRNAQREHHEPEATIERQWRELDCLGEQLTQEPFNVLYHLVEGDEPHVRLVMARM